MGAAHRIEGGGDLDGAKRAGWRQAALRWTDPESGESLYLELAGPAEWIEELRSQGFERLSDLPALDGDGVAGGRAGFEAGG